MSHNFTTSSNVGKWVPSADDIDRINRILASKKKIAPEKKPGRKYLIVKEKINPRQCQLLTAIRKGYKISFHFVNYKNYCKLVNGFKH